MALFQFHLDGEAVAVYFYILTILFQSFVALGLHFIFELMRNIHHLYSRMMPLYRNYLRACGDENMIAGLNDAASMPAVSYRSHLQKWSKQQASITIASWAERWHHSAIPTIRWWRRYFQMLHLRNYHCDPPLSIGIRYCIFRPLERINAG